MSEFSNKLAAAINVPAPPPPCPVQLLFNRYKKHLDQRVVATPLPEDVTFLTENFPYLIQLENPDPKNLAEWVPSKASMVVPLLENRIFDQNGFRFEPLRSKALFNLPDLLRKPNCIHDNLRNGLEDGIDGDFIYVGYYPKKLRKVAFTIKHTHLDKIIVVSSFWTNKEWVADCTRMPATYVGPGCTCTCK